MDANKIKLSFIDAGEYCANIPLLPAHTTMVKQSSNFADCANISKISHSDSSFAAAFLKEFSYCPNFTHIDIAGTIEYKKYPINPFCLVLYKLNELGLHEVYCFYLQTFCFLCLNFFLHQASDLLLIDAICYNYISPLL